MSFPAAPLCSAVLSLWAPPSPVPCSPVPHSPPSPVPQSLLPQFPNPPFPNPLLLPGLEPCVPVLGFSAGHKDMLTRLATHGPKNPKLEMLEQILLKQFGSADNPRGIIFTRTRQSAHSLLLWLQQQPGLQKVDIRAQLLIGAGNSSQTTHMTQVGAVENDAGAARVP